MSAIAASRPGRLQSRRQRAAAVVEAALRGGLLASIVAFVAWLAVSIIAGTAFVLLVIATLVVAAYGALGRRDVSLGVWGVLAVGWAVVLLERALAHGHGGVWVAAAGWLGVVYAARRAGISRWALPLLAYPALSIAIVIGAGESLLHPWGISWLWVAAVLGPVLGARVLLAPRERDHA